MNGTKILGKGSISKETKGKKEETRGVWLSGRLHIIEERLNEGPWLTLHGGQSRSWSAKQGKENKRKSLAAHLMADG